MATRAKKRSPVKATPTSTKKAKSPPRDALPRVASPVIDPLFASLPPLTNVQRQAFRDQWSPLLCDEAGELTESADVYQEASGWAPIIDRTLNKVPQAVRRYSKARFAWYLECLHDLGQVMDAQLSGQRSPNAARHRVEGARKTALTIHAELIEALTVLAGGDILERRALAAATGATDTPDALASSLRALSRLAEGWLERESPSARALVSSIDLTTADLDAARAATHALAFASYEAAHGTRSDRDAPAVNRAEGRVLFEMGLVMRIFERAHLLNNLVPKLTPRPALRIALCGPDIFSASGEVPPTLEQPVTTREGQQNTRRA
jgi:hypothetical protein